MEFLYAPACSAAILYTDPVWNIFSVFRSAGRMDSDVPIDRIPDTWRRSGDPSV
jgi:hypothetical protein